MDIVCSDSRPAPSAATCGVIRYSRSLNALNCEFWFVELELKSEASIVSRESVRAEILAGSSDEGAFVRDAGSKAGRGCQRGGCNRRISPEIRPAKGIPQFAVDQTVERLSQERRDGSGVNLCLLVRRHLREILKAKARLGRRLGDEAIEIDEQSIRHNRAKAVCIERTVNLV